METLRKPDEVADGIGRSVGSAISEEAQKLQHLDDEWATPRKTIRKGDATQRAKARGKLHAFVSDKQEWEGRCITKKQRPMQRKRKTEVSPYAKTGSPLPPHYSIYGRYGVLIEEPEEPSRQEQK